MGIALLKIALGLALLLAGSEVLWRLAARGCAYLRMPVGVNGLMLLLFGAAFGPLYFAPHAAMGASPELALGALMGGVAVAVLFFLPLTALAAPFAAPAALVKQESLALAGQAAAFWLLASDGALSRADGLVMLACAAAYTRYALHNADARLQSEWVLRASRAGLKLNRWSGLAFVLGALACLSKGSDLLADGGAGFAAASAHTETALGLTLVAAALCLPPLLSGFLQAILRNNDVALTLSLSLANIVLGAGVGLAALFSPMPVAELLLSRDVPLLFACLALLCLTLYLRRGMGRPEALLFIALYAGYVIYVLSH